MFNTQEELCIAFLTFLSIGITITGVMLKDLILIFAGVATILLTTLLLVGFVVYAKKIRYGDKKRLI
jgi:hypothetical protein